MNSRDPVPDRLIAVARELFTGRGYEGTSVRDITSRARANLGAITYHFGSKKSLYNKVIETFAEPMAERVAQAAQAPGTALDKVEAIARAALAHLLAHPGAPSILLRELAADHPLPPPMARVMKRNLTTLAEVIGAGQREGSIRPGDPVLLAMSVVSQPFFVRIAGRMIREALGLDPADPAQQARVVNHVAESVRRVLANYPKAES